MCLKRYQPSAQQMWAGDMTSTSGRLPAARIRLTCTWSAAATLCNIWAHVTSKSWAIPANPRQLVGSQVFLRPIPPIPRFATTSTHRSKMRVSGTTPWCLFGMTIETSKSCNTFNTFNACLPTAVLANFRYTHQLVPYSNPSWDSNKYAVDTSLQPQPGLNLGVSLYGETTYGNSMIRWLHGQGHTHYGVTEFHPLKQLSPEELKTTLSQHQTAGAQFISMFVEGRWQGHYMSEDRNLFAFDPDNHAYGSDALFSALKAILNDPGTRLDRPSLPAPPKGLMKFN